MSSEIHGTRFVIHPGDSVMLITNRLLTLEEASEIRDQLRERHPDVQFTIIGGFHSAIVTRAS